MTYPPAAVAEIVFEWEGRRYTADLSDPIPLAIPLDFNGAQPSYFGVHRAHSAPLSQGSWIGDVVAGGSVNCSTLSLVPHCNGTHTECVGHLTTDRVTIQSVLKGGLFPCRLVTATPGPIAGSGDSPDPGAWEGEPVICARGLADLLGRWPGHSPALVLRTLPNDPSRWDRVYEGGAPAPYLTPEAAALLAALGIEHLVTDLPSLDRARDDGRLRAHRAFFGLDASSRRAADARRPQATITELAWIAPAIRDGWYLLDLQIPAFLSDAAPSRPLLYPLHSCDSPAG